MRVPPYGGVYVSLRRTRLTDDESQVDLPYFPALELLGQVGVGPFVLGNDDKA